MGNRQKNYIFNRQKQLIFYLESDLPFGGDSAKSILKERLLKEGYLAKDFFAKKLWVVQCSAAYAKRDTYKERLRLQKDIEKKEKYGNYAKIVVEKKKTEVS